MRPPLHVASFGGGVVIAGAADQRRIDEISAADAIDIGPRGALIAASDRTDYTTLLNSGAAAWDRLHAILEAVGVNFSRVLAIGEGLATYLLQVFDRTGAGATIPWGASGTVFQYFTPPFNSVPVTAEGVIVTAATFPGVFDVNVGAGTVKVNVLLVCLGAREGFTPRSAPGLYAIIVFPPSSTPAPYAIGLFDALGTGRFSADFPLGSNAQQLFPRGVIGYNNHAFAWGFDAADVANGDGPNRVMFSNLGAPLKWGNDNQGVVGANRAFTDSDAIVMGDAGEIIRAAIKIFGKLFFGTDRGLHWIAGYGRDSFLTDGATPVMRAYNTVGPHGLIEGPDKLLYGVGDQGLWRFGGEGVPDPLFLKVTDFDGHSNGYFDCIWTDASRGANALPGRTNQDLVWTAVDWDRQQVLVGIPWCNATLGWGYGTDTVVIKYHVLTGGFTRQVFTGVQFTARGYFRRVGQQPDTRFLGTATAGRVTIQRYGYTAVANDTPVMPSPLPVVTLGPYAPFGPDGRGALKRLYLTLAWESAGALPIVFTIATTWDQRSSDSFTLSLQNVAPGAPATNDLWLDTSLADTNLGNATAGALTPAFPSALLKRWSGTAWQQLPGQGSNGTRATIRLPLVPRNGTRVTVTATCTAATGRFQIEGLGEMAGGVQAAA